MAGVKISALSPLPSALLTDVAPWVQGGVTYKGSNSQLAALFQAHLSFLPLAGGTLTGDLILSSSSPPTALSAASKGYVDSVAQGITVQGACRLGTTTALTVVYSNGSSGVGATLTNNTTQAALTLDGVAAVAGDRILVKNQVSALQNGIYTVTNIGSGSSNWVMTRATDYDQPAEIQPGDLVIITAGNTLTSSSWIQTDTVNTIGTDAIAFSQFSAALPITVPNGGTGLVTMTAYGLLSGGTTSTGNVQVITPGAAGTILRSGGASALSTWSTSTYPSTNAINTLLYASSANVMAALTTANSSWLTTSSGGVPTWNSNLPFNSINIQRITTAGAGTYTPTAGMVAVIVQAQAAGGGSGGCATAGATQFSLAQGGGGGEYIEALFTAAQIGASKGYVVGAKGGGGAAGTNNGANGGNTTFNTTWIITIGGLLGAGGSSAAASQIFFGSTNGASGGSVSTGKLIKQIPGGNCTVALAFVNQALASAGGTSANSPLLVGAQILVSTGLAATNALTNSGGGGGAPATYNGGTQLAGANGADGFLNFIEFLSI